MMRCSALAFLLALAGCAPGPSGPAPGGVDGHQRMVAILDSIARNASPLDCYNLNLKMAALIEAQIPTLPPERRMAAQFRHAEQLLFGGRVEAAIMALLEVVGLIKDELRPDTRIVYETLALAYLRLGEVENCVERPAGASCILPIQAEGVYQLTSGARNAIAVYERILKAYPDDLQSQWLLNIAYMNLGLWPSGVPAPYRMPKDLFEARGPIGFVNTARQRGVDTRGLSGGVCAEDFDNDGDIDLFVTSYGLSDPCHFYVNNGDGTFVDRTREAGLMGITSGLNTLHCDYNNDGFRDITVLRGGWLEGGTHPNSLLRNNGDGTFTDVTIEAGLLDFHPTQAAAWADFDGDGWLDLYVANESRGRTPDREHPNALYRNNGDGTFTDVAPRLGLNLKGFFKGVCWGDINNDQRPDLILTTMGGPVRLLINRGGQWPARWTFEDATARAGLQTPGFNFPLIVFDVDNDGLDDILIGGYKLDPSLRATAGFVQHLMGASPPGAYLSLFRNLGNEGFEDATDRMGLRTETWAMGINAGDLDNDGWIDFYLGTGTPNLQDLLPNRMFRNEGGRRFQEITFNGFAHVQKGHGIAFADFDNDGDQDIYAVMGGAYEGDVANNALFENPGNGNAWVQLELEGRKAHRDALLARVALRVRTPDGGIRTVYSRCGTGGSFGSGSIRMEIGLGAGAVLEGVEVDWPRAGSAPEQFSGVKPGGRYKLTEGSGAAVVLRPPG